MATNKTPTERLDAMSRFFFDDDGIVDQIKALQDSILPTTAECDAVSAELGALYAQYDGVRGMAQDARERIVQINYTMSGGVELMGVMEAQASLDAFGVNEVTGKPYTVAQTAARAKVALAADEAYRTLRNSKRELERDKASARAIVDSLDASLSEYRNRNRALVAQLRNLTARLGG